METPFEPMDPFEILMSPMDSVITMVFINSLRTRVLNIFVNYKDASLSNPNAVEEILQIVRDGTKDCLLQISKKYMKNILEYLSNDGLVLYISTHVKQLVENELRTQMSDINKSGVR